MKNINNWISIVDRKVNQSVVNSDELLSGKSGLILYHYSRWKALNNIADYNKVEHYIQSIFDNIENQTPLFYGTGWGNGIAGFAHVCTYLMEENFLDLNIKEVFVEIDKILFEQALEEINECSTDYLHTSIGILHYFSSRIEEAYIAEYIQILLSKILGIAIIDEYGLRFENSFMKREEKEYNLSLSHGLAGVLLVFLSIYEKDTTAKRILKDTIYKGIKYIVTYHRHSDKQNGEFSEFPSVIKVNTQEPFYGNRLAWCYGDLNIVLLLYRAGYIFGNYEWIELADRVGAKSVKRKTTDETGISGAFFCHGTAGLAQFYKTLYEINSLSIYKEAHSYWLNQTLLYLKEGVNQESPVGLLEGLAGVGLTLLSAQNKNLTWSKLFLL